MLKNINLSKNTFYIASLIFVAVCWRVINFNYHIAPNLEIVTAVSVLAAVTFGLRGAIAVPIITMILSDLIIGNSSIFIFTWTSFALIGAGATILKKLNNKPKTQITSSIGFAIVSSFTFFVITNFGVWVQGWYPATLAGLIDCFTMAIPFYRTMLIGNIILVPTVVALRQFIIARQFTNNLVINSLVSK